MSGISIISNFDVNINAPIDSRIVATNSTQRNSIVHKYDGLKVYQLDTKENYTWDETLSSWTIGSNGIYGGDGSLVKNTTVDTGVISSTVGSQSRYFRLGSTAGSDITYLQTNNNRHTSGTTWDGVEWKTQFIYNLEFGPYISFNPNSPAGEGGGVSIGTGDAGYFPTTEKIRITPSGKFGINTNDPKEIFQINASSTDPAFAPPITVHKGGVNIIASNWYYAGVDSIFDLTKASSKIVFDPSNGDTTFSNRIAGGGSSSFTTGMIISGTGSVLTYQGIQNNSGNILNIGGGFIRNNGQFLSNNGGSASSPGFSFNNETNSGIYNPSTNVISTSINGKNVSSLDNYHLIKYTDGASQSSCYVLEGSASIKGIGIVGSVYGKDYVIKTITFPNDDQAKIIIIEATFIGRFTTDLTPSYKVEKLQATYTLSNIGGFFAATSSISTFGSNLGSLEISGSLNVSTAYNISFKQRFKSNVTSTTAVQTSMVSYKIIVMNDYKEDISLVTGTQLFGGD